MSESVINSDAASTLPIPTLARRDFLVSVLGAGFALAVSPVRSETMVSTDAEGLLSGEVSIPVADGKLPAYRSAPKGKGPHPVILVVQEIFGVHEHIKDITRRLAKLGYLAIAPELYARQGDVSKLTSIDEIRDKVVSKVPDAQVMADLDATVAWAAGNGGDTACLAITGFCWGGRIVWLYTAHQPKIKAGIAWYGRLVGQSTPTTPVHPVDVAAKLQAQCRIICQRHDGLGQTSAVPRLHHQATLGHHFGNLCIAAAGGDHRSPACQHARQFGGQNQVFRFRALRQ